MGALKGMGPGECGEAGSLVGSEGSKSLVGAVEAKVAGWGCEGGGRWYADGMRWGTGLSVGYWSELGGAGEGAYCMRDSSY